MRRQIAAVKLHTLDIIDGRVEALAFFDGDDAVFADPHEGLGHLLADLDVVVGSDGGDIDNVVFFADVDGLGQCLQLFDGGLDRFLHSAIQAIASAPAARLLEGLLEHRLGQHRRGGSAVAGDLGGLAGRFLTSLAPMFSALSKSSISSATVTPSLVTVGPPHPLSMMAHRPRGPSVDLDRRRQLFHAGQQGHCGHRFQTLNLLLP